MGKYALHFYKNPLWIYTIGEGHAPRPLVWLMAGSPEQAPLEELLSLLDDAVLQERCVPCAIAGASPSCWNDDYSPWPLEMPDGRRFGGQADALMNLTLMQWLPEVQNRFRFDGRRFAVGYSLGGLAALYYAAQGGWNGCGSCSGSLWYPGFVEWLASHPPACPVYFSLGGREKNTSDPLMARVEACTRSACQLLRPAVKTTFVHEPGGHFRGTAQRLFHAIEWLLSSENPAKRSDSV